MITLLTVGSKCWWHTSVGRHQELVSLEIENVLEAVVHVEPFEPNVMPFESSVKARFFLSKSWQNT